MTNNGRFVLGENSQQDLYLTGQRFVIVFNETNTHKVMVNGLEKATFDSSNFKNQDQSKKIMIFATSGYEPKYGTSNTRIYWCKIRENGVLLRDFIPVRVGDVGYLYDSVSGQLFGNAGTGSFVIGPDKTI